MLTLAASVVVGLGLLEIGVRLTGYEPPTISADMYLDRSGEPDEKVWPYALRPGYVGSYAGGAVSIDMEGERSVVVEDAVRAKLDASPTAATWLVVGDSVAFGQGLNDHETLASQLATALASRAVPIRVRNVAAPGYTSVNELAAAKRYFASHGAERVIVVYVANDATFDDDQLKLKEGFALQGQSAWHRATRSLYEHVYVSFLISDSFKRLGSMLTEPPSSEGFWSTISDDAIERSLDALAELEALSAAHGAKLSVAINRDISYYELPAPAEAFERRVLKGLEQRKMDAFVLSSYQKELPLDEACVSPMDAHPSRKAVGLMVNDIVAHIERTEPAP